MGTDSSRFLEFIERMLLVIEDRVERFEIARAGIEPSIDVLGAV